ncbi:hypothetical protein LINPERHAP1_LOCUS23301, partial [Linum perenne]
MELDSGGSIEYLGCKDQPRRHQEIGQKSTSRGRSEQSRRARRRRTSTQLARRKLGTIVRDRGDVLGSDGGGTCECLLPCYIRRLPVNDQLGGHVFPSRFPT